MARRAAEFCMPFFHRQMIQVSEDELDGNSPWRKPPSRAPPRRRDTQVPCWIPTSIGFPASFSYCYLMLTLAFITLLSKYMVGRRHGKMSRRVVAVLGVTLAFWATYKVSYNLGKREGSSERPEVEQVTRVGHPTCSHVMAQLLPPCCQPPHGAHHFHSRYASKRLFFKFLYAGTPARSQCAACLHFGLLGLSEPSVAFLLHLAGRVCTGSWAQVQERRGPGRAAADMEEIGRPHSRARKGSTVLQVARC
jgi:hypothetical protein